MIRKIVLWLIPGLVTLVLGTALTASPAIAADPSVIGDNSVAAYIGNGGLLLPGSFSGTSETRKSVAECLGCTWSYTIYCQQGAGVPCKHAVVTCPKGSLLYRVGFGLTSETVATIGSVCWGSSKPVTRRDVETKLNDQVIRYVPSLKPGFSPSGGSLTAIPVIFWSGQPTNFRPPAFSLSGHKVKITATPTWRWVWADGNSAWKSVPGADYPIRQITHQYRSPGTYVVGVTAVWTAEYTVAGLGTFAVAGEVIRQSKAMTVPIRSARTVLVSH